MKTDFRYLSVALVLYAGANWAGAQGPAFGGTIGRHDAGEPINSKLIPTSQ